jgi:hypothetical protein
MVAGASPSRRRRDSDLVVDHRDVCYALLAQSLPAGVSTVLSLEVSYGRLLFCDQSSRCRSRDKYF